MVYNIKEIKETFQNPQNWSDDGVSDEIDKFLKNPFSGFSDEICRIRRNLLIFTTIALVYHYSDTTLTSLIFFGVVVDGWKPFYIEKVLLIFIIYHCVHFSWCVWETYQEKNISFSDIKELKNMLYEEKRFFRHILEIDKIINIENRRFKRWAVLEAGLPLALSLWALSLLALAFWNS
ncbi:MAG: hypothetical protein K0U39_05725 [Alphaproteobacteria bacterium]|nr:hypothetical protein [Alphaproteobacteria bacterium]